MADYLRAALDTYATPSHRVVLFLDSVGGQVEEGDRTVCQQPPPRGPLRTPAA
jgi:hypothetical protein